MGAQRRLRKSLNSSASPGNASAKSRSKRWRKCASGLRSEILCPSQWLWFSGFHNDHGVIKSVNSNMSILGQIITLLRWRLAQAELIAPPPPRPSDLLKTNDRLIAWFILHTRRRQVRALFKKLTAFELRQHHCRRKSQQISCSALGARLASLRIVSGLRSFHLFGCKTQRQSCSRPQRRCALTNEGLYSLDLSRFGGG